MKRCRKCGSEMNDSDLFCSVCGAKYEEQINTGNVVPEAANTSTAVLNERKSDTTVLGAAYNVSDNTVNSPAYFNPNAANNQSQSNNPANNYFGGNFVAGNVQNQGANINTGNNANQNFGANTQNNYYRKVPNNTFGNPQTQNNGFRPAPTGNNGFQGPARQNFQNGNFSQNEKMSFKDFFEQFASKKTKNNIKSFTFIAFLSAVFSIGYTIYESVEYGGLYPELLIACIIDVAVCTVCGFFIGKKKSMAAIIVLVCYGAVGTIISLVGSSESVSGIAALAAGIMSLISCNKVRNAYKVYSETGETPAYEI